MSEQRTGDLTPIGETVGLGQTRDATCRCGEKFTQTKFAHSWVPSLCQTCRPSSPNEKAEDARAVLARASLAVPARYRDVTLESFQLHGGADEQARQGRVLQLARRYVGLWPEVPDVVVLRGGPGTGKGHVAWSVAKTLAGSFGVPVVFTSLPDAIRDLRESWRRTDSGDTEATRLNRYRRAGLLVIDEVSRHAFYGEPQRHLYDLIDYRVNWLLPTILTTNETTAGLAEILGPALTSRAAGSSGIWEFGERDYRLHGKEAA